MISPYYIHLYWEGRIETREQLAHRIIETLKLLETRAEYASWAFESMKRVTKITADGKKRRKKVYAKEQVQHDIPWISQRLDAYRHQDGEFDSGLGYCMRLTAASGLELWISAGGEGVPKSNPLSVYHNKIVLTLRASTEQELKDEEFKLLLMSLVPIWEADRGVVLTREILRRRVGTGETNRATPGVWLYERETGEVSFHPELITGDSTEMGVT